MIRTALAILVMAVVSAVGIPLQWISLKLNLPTQRLIPLVFHRIAAPMLGVRVTVSGAPSNERPLLLVSNHSSWLDIVVLSSILPVVFVAKSEIAKWPLFGLFARLQRSIFVNRSKRQETTDVNRAIASRLTNGDPVVLFGEGTASDGNRVLPFRSALLGALKDSLGANGRSHVQPVSIVYTRLQGVPMGRHFRHVAAWYGDMSLPGHLRRVLREGAIDVVVTFGVPLAVEPATDRKALARITEDAVRRMTIAVLSGREAPREMPLSQGHPAAVSLPAESR